MKLSQLSILFVGILLVVLFLSDIKSDNLTAVAEAKNDMDAYMNQAMEAATASIIQTDTSTGKEVVDKDKAANNFFSSMYASLGILSDPVAQEKFRAYVPVIAVTEEDGYYLMYNEEYVGTDGYTYISIRWTEKLPYSYEDDFFIYRFTMDTDMVLYDKNHLLNAGSKIRAFKVSASDIRTGDDYAALRVKLKSKNFLLNEENFNLVRRQAIINCMEKDLPWYISKHNKIAEHYGITYQFALPVADTSEWNKTIVGPGIIVIFQGMPLTEGYSKVYNRMNFAGSNVTKDMVYYIEQKKWYNIYHKAGCPKLEGNPNVLDEPRYSVEEAASIGAYACSICDPAGIFAPGNMP